MLTDKNFLIGLVVGGAVVYFLLPRISAAKASAGATKHQRAQQG